jgi:hypothetical protein
MAGQTQIRRGLFGDHRAKAIEPMPYLGGAVHLTDPGREDHAQIRVLGLDQPVQKGGEAVGRSDLAIQQNGTAHDESFLMPLLRLNRLPSSLNQKAEPSPIDQTL